MTNFITRHLDSTTEFVPTLRTPTPPTDSTRFGAVDTPRMEIARPSVNTATRRSAIYKIRKAMTKAAGVRRSNGPEGREFLISKRETRRLDSRLGTASTRNLQMVARELQKLQTRDTPRAAGVFLRAVCTRLPQLGSSQRQTNILQRFSRELQGFTDAEIMKRSTCLDLDSTQNTNTNNPSALSLRRGVIRSHYENDGQTNNDGIFQRFTGSCGPTTLQMWLAETDPVLAFALHKNNVSSDSTKDAAAEFQRIILETYDGIAVGKMEKLLLARVRNGLGNLKSRGKVSASGKKGLLAYVSGERSLNAPGKRALRTLRESFDGFPSKAELKRLRSSQIPKTDDGMSNAGFAQILNHFSAQMTGTTYLQTNPEWGFRRGGARAHLDNVAKALRAGYDVPFCIAEPGHYMLLTDVKGRGTNRSFLVSDPESAKTVWIEEDDFVKGDCFKREFELCWPHQRGYIDGFFLPEVTLQ